MQANGVKTKFMDGAQPTMGTGTSILGVFWRANDKDAAQYGMLLGRLQAVLG